MTDPARPTLATTPTTRAARSLTETPALADLAAQLLQTEGALSDLGLEDAAAVVGYMGLVTFPAGATVFREGDSSRTSYLLLVLSGEVSVETADPRGGGQVAISILGPGNIIGEMGLLDGSPRSATCIATTALQAGGLSRKALEKLIEDNPRVGAKLLVGLSKRLAARLRGMSDQLLMYAQLTESMQQEIQALKARAGGGTRF
ncbi:cyclic nucleotide-binding domain-containing protein [Piscinibacter sakaiensis]|uniref:cAMP-binding proteins n=1 Tax=Piscinibacter sakaiensis TaxID=1547922 RepID=A0A0K8NUC9_PISS1|nr:cyclic nucleotide-binding domain-containing protein [Piscinibacter sakaiensis]GAP33555.1 cAMP-binding proteins [Piscinibacter sakaiensis]